MTALPVSVIVVSRGRPKALARCLTGIGQLYHPNFEIVVVSDQDGLAAIGQLGLTGRIKAALFEDANISAARNCGIGVAAGQVIAFIDDDAVPEPTWLTRLTAPFDGPQVVAAGGFVLGRNGISFQWKARDIRPDGVSAPLPVAEDGVTILQGRPDWGIKTEGTNMAFRRDVIAAMGGFDPAFRFYLDETDLNLRLAASGGHTAIVPDAHVHHGFAESDRRRADRVPLNLFEEGASRAVFLRKHAPDQLEHRLRSESAAQRQRLIKHMVGGGIESRDVNRILDTFHAGWTEGLKRIIAPLALIGSAAMPFLPFTTELPHKPHVFLSARSYTARQTAAKAETLVAQGHTVSVLLLSPTARYHHVRFDPRGFWLQTGGLFGRSTRTEPLFRFRSLHARTQLEVERVRPFREAPASTQAKP